MTGVYTIDVLVCEEADVFVGTSEDIPGLTLEADTLGALIGAAVDMVPELLTDNVGPIPTDSIRMSFRVHPPDIPMDVTSVRHPPIVLEGPIGRQHAVQ